LALGFGLGRNAQEALEPLAVAFGTFDRFAIKDKGFKGVVTLAAGIFIERH
jgi:hypothetical protein